MHLICSNTIAIFVERAVHFESGGLSYRLIRIMEETTDLFFEHRFPAPKFSEHIDSPPFRLLIVLRTRTLNISRLSDF
jgi:hypothetical protein